MILLDREGVFRATALSWTVQPAEQTNSVAINLDFKILAQLNTENEWEDWAEFDDHRTYGKFFVIKKDGTINPGPVEQLARSLGWNGDLTSVALPPPTIQIQVTVKADEYKGKVRYLVSWLNPGDYVPFQGAAIDDIRKLQTQYGSLLRAAATSVLPKPSASKSPPPAFDENAGIEQFVDDVAALNAGKHVPETLDDWKYDRVEDIPQDKQQEFIDLIKAFVAKGKK